MQNAHPCLPLSNRQQKAVRQSQKDISGNELHITLASKANSRNQASFSRPVQKVGQVWQITDSHRLIFRKKPIFKHLRKIFLY